MLHIGTSATMVSGGNRAERKLAVAEVATKLFGAEVKPENVVDKTLRRAIEMPAPQTSEALRAAVEAPLPAETLESFRRNPLAAWVEETFGVATEEGRLVRRKPITFAEGVSQLSKYSGVPEPACADRLQSLLSVGNRIQTEYGEPVFAFRLHQFLAAGGTVYATLELASSRYLTLQGEYYAPGGDGDRLVYPLAFCRECGPGVLSSESPAGRARISSLRACLSSIPKTRKMTCSRDTLRPRGRTLERSARGRTAGLLVRRTKG